MTKSSCLFLCTLLILTITQDVSAARGFGRGSHSYPKSGGLSGHGGSHSYPSNHGGLSGSHGYPPSGGLSGNNRGGSHTYPSSGGSHGYPASGGLSGNSPGYQGKPNTYNTHTSHTTNIHNNYHYTPPQQIRYTPTHGGAPMNYPVYRGTPPNYVYQYKDSGSKYGTLLAGLALMNLGTLGVAAYALHNSNSNSHSSSYKPQAGEVCKFGLRKDNGDYEETKIDCQLISSFIIQAEQEKSQNGGGTNTSVVTTTVTNVTMVNTTNGEAVPAPASEANIPGNIIYSMLPNGTLVPLNGTSVNATANATNSEAPATNGISTSSVVTTTTTNTTVTNALDVKGKPIDVTPGMKCYVIRNSPTSNMRRSVPCGLLQTYADTSLKKNSATRTVPVFTIFAATFAMLLMY